MPLTVRRLTLNLFVHPSNSDPTRKEFNVSEGVKVHFVDANHRAADLVSLVPLHILGEEVLRIRCPPCACDAPPAHAMPPLVHPPL